MKKGICVILPLLLIAALAMMGCLTDGGDTDDAFTVTFDKNGGTSEADPKTASTTTSAGTVTLPTTNPGAPAGKQFAG